ncbi:MAG: SpoIIE family protein phosphatase [Anaerolineae bacterium]
MTPPVVEFASRSLSKAGEELCGDCVKVSRTQDGFLAVLSDGLGSGVKANILATLTTEIIATMIERGAAIEDVIDTLIETLPECQIRRLAYATFSILKVSNGEEAYIAEYDSPPLLIAHEGNVTSPPVREREVRGRKIREGSFYLHDGDYMVMVSDGVLHAGVGGFYKLGWGWHNLAIAIRRWADTRPDAYHLAEAIGETASRLYGDRPGDDTTVAAMRVRPEISITVMTGPPSKPDLDETAVGELMASPGLKAVCGGTTAQIVARVLGQPLAVQWRPDRNVSGDRIPPIATINGLDLVTEGVITLSKATEHLQKVETIHDLPHQNDGATRLARILLQADRIHFMVGDAINPQQIADVVRGKPMRQIYLEELIETLRDKGKIVTLKRW